MIWMSGKVFNFALGKGLFQYLMMATPSVIQNGFIGDKAPPHAVLITLSKSVLLRCTGFSIMVNSFDDSI